MRIINTSSQTVPFGKYWGYDLQEMAETDPHYALWMLRETDLRSKYPDAYYDLEYYLRAVPRARSWMSWH
ncbi:hypothetical protein C5B96_08565 [Subtercola sp. Z020]|nr:hypothetical protein C5B96_08565 [Subtercola sp. Z020]